MGPRAITGQTLYLDNSRGIAVSTQPRTNPQNFAPGYTGMYQHSVAPRRRFFPIFTSRSAIDHVPQPAPPSGSGFGRLNPANPFSENSSPFGRYNPSNPFSEVSSPFSKLNKNNPFSDVSSPFGKYNPNNPFAEGVHPATIYGR